MYNLSNHSKKSYKMLTINNLKQIIDFPLTVLTMYYIHHNHPLLCQRISVQSKSPFPYPTAMVVFCTEKMDKFHQWLAQLTRHFEYR